MTDPHPPIVCAGTARQIGQQQGEQLAERVRACEHLIDELTAFQLGRPFWLPYRIYRWLARRRAAQAWRRSLDLDAPDMAGRLRGIAEGSGARLDELQLVNVMEPVLSDLTSVSQVGPPGGCSALAVRGGRSRSGHPVIARNFDYLRLVQPFYCLRELRPEEGYRSLEFTVAPLVGAVDGINEKGLAITNNYAYVTDHGKPGRTITMAVSQALSKCADTTETVAWFAAHPVWGGGILMVADAGGDLASIELSNTRRAVRRPVGDALFHTNKFNDATMNGVQIGGDRYYGPGAVPQLRGVRIHESAEQRDARIGQLLADRPGPLGAEDLQAIMADHGPGGRPSLDSVCMHSDYWYTTASVQLLPVERRMRIAFTSACEAQLVDFELAV